MMLLILGNIEKVLSEMNKIKKILISYLLRKAAINYVRSSLYGKIRKW